MSSDGLPGNSKNRPLRAVNVVVRLTARWQDGIDFESGWTALLTGFTAPNAYVTRVGDGAEMVAEFPDPGEAVRFAVHLETTLGAKVLLEKTTVN